MAGRLYPVSYVSSVPIVLPVRFGLVLHRSACTIRAHIINRWFVIHIQVMYQYPTLLSHQQQQSDVHSSTYISSNLVRCFFQSRCVCKCTIGGVFARPILMVSGQQLYHWNVCQGWKILPDQGKCAWGMHKHHSIWAAPRLTVDKVIHFSKWDNAIILKCFSPSRLAIPKGAKCEFEAPCQYKSR